MEFKEYEHLPTIVKVHILQGPANVETSGGTIAARTGDALIIGANGNLYVIQPDEFYSLFKAR